MIVHSLNLTNNVEEFVLQEVAGTGGWGKVYRAIRQSDQKIVGLKFFGYTELEPLIHEINSEVMLMMSLIGVHGNTLYTSPSLLSLFFFNSNK